MYESTAVLNAALSDWQKGVGELVRLAVVGLVDVGVFVGFPVGELVVGEFVGLPLGELVVGEFVGS